jgi:hypothetical protein
LVTNPVATALRRALVPKALRARLSETFAPDQAELARLFPGLALAPLRVGAKEQA